MIREQTVGHHCWRVATIFVEVFGIPRAEVLYYCLHHDSGELWAGDMPYGIKKTVRDLKPLLEHAEEVGLAQLRIHLPELTKEELVRVKICDLLEMHETGWHEMNLGNKYAEPIMNDTRIAAIALANEHCMSEHVIEWLQQRGSI
jgi:5'-deoxynucleotidase YfbR-like HD superfamily hydrolase